MRPTTTTLALRRALVALAVVVLALGLPRLLVWCDHGGGDRHVEFVHAPGDCCATAPLAAWPAEDLPADLDRAGGAADCEHTAFAIELVPAPRHRAADRNHSPPSWAAMAAMDAPATPPPLRGAPRATGPPRTDQRTERRRSTVLLL